MRPGVGEIGLALAFAVGIQGSKEFLRDFTYGGCVAALKRKGFSKGFLEELHGIPKIEGPNIVP